MSEPVMRGEPGHCAADSTNRSTWIVTGTVSASMALVAARWTLSNQLHETEWVVAGATALAVSMFLAAFAIIPAVLIGCGPVLLASRRWSGAALVVPLIVLPVVYSSWHRISVMEILVVMSLSMVVAAGVMWLFFRRSRGADLCRECGYPLIPQQLTCSECGARRLPNTPPFPANWAEFRAGLGIELRTSERAFFWTLALLVLAGCIIGSWKVRRTEGELKAFLDSGALIGLTAEQAERKLHVKAVFASPAEAEFEFDHLAGWFEFGVPYISVKLDNGVIREATYAVEDY